MAGASWGKGEGIGYGLEIGNGGTALYCGKIYHHRLRIWLRQRYGNGHITTVFQSGVMALGKAHPRPAVVVKDGDGGNAGLGYVGSAQCQGECFHWFDRSIVYNRQFQQVAGFPRRKGERAADGLVVAVGAGRAWLGGVADGLGGGAGPGGFYGHGHGGAAAFANVVIRLGQPELGGRWLGDGDVGRPGAGVAAMWVVDGEFDAVDAGLGVGVGCPLLPAVLPIAKMPLPTGGVAAGQVAKVDGEGSGAAHNVGDKIGCWLLVAMVDGEGVEHVASIKGVGVAGNGR